MFKFKTKLFFLPIEIKTRELYSKLYFAKKALERNYSIFIGDKAGIFRATKYFNSGVYFYKSINSIDTEHIRKITKKNNKYVVLDEEGGFSFSSKDEYIKFLSHRSSPINVSLIDKFFNWGNFDYKICVNQYPNFKKKFKISGGLRFEICEKQIFKKIYKKFIQNNKSKEKSLLITTSHLTSKKEIENYLRSDEVFMNLSTNLLKIKRKNELNNLLALHNSFRKLIKALLKKFDKMKIIIRPHPSENIEDWKFFLNNEVPFNDLKRIEINVDEDLNTVIDRSFCVINSKSSSSLHALFQGKPVISYIPKGNKSKKRIMDFVGVQVTTIKQVENKVRLILNKSFRNIVNEKRDKLLSNNVYNYKRNKKSSCIILDEVDKIYNGKSDINKLLIRFLSPFYLISDFIFKILKIRYYSENYSKSAIRLRSEKLHDGIKKEEILEFLENFNLKKRINVFSFGRSCFLLYKKR